MVAENDWIFEPASKFSPRCWISRILSLAVALDHGLGFLDANSEVCLEIAELGICGETAPGVGVREGQAKVGAF